jgi:predicted pyridoxine 5'-phosphate oxidase superfamily flavin-nucleotide-binding protein
MLRNRGGPNMAKMTKEVMEVVNDPASAKVLATAGTGLEINAVPKGSLRAIDEERIAFADIFGDKTNKNLEVNKKVSALAFKTSPVAGYQIKGTFLGFQTSGQLFDRFAKEIKERIKLDIKAVGTIRVDEVYAVAPPEPGKKIA